MTVQLQHTVIQAKQGDHDAFKRIFDDLNNRLFYYAERRTRSRDDALDIVQDTFVDVWRALVSFTYESDEAFYGFVFTILKRTIYRHRLRAPHTRAVEENSNTSEQHGHYEDARGAEDMLDVRIQLNTLTPKHRELVKLRYWFGLPFRDIASTMHIKETTAKVWHHRALQTLKRNTIQNHDNA